MGIGACSVAVKTQLITVRRTTIHCCELITLNTDGPVDSGETLKRVDSRTLSVDSEAKG